MDLLLEHRNIIEFRRLEGITMIMRNKGMMASILIVMVCLLFAACGADQATSGNTDSSQAEAVQTETVI